MSTAKLRSLTFRITSSFSTEVSYSAECEDGYGTNRILD